MRYIASCSGGKDSVATLILTKLYGEPLDEVIYSEVLFTREISGEVPEHRDFIYNKLKLWVERELNVPFTILQSEQTYVECFQKEIVRGPNLGKTRSFPSPGMCWVNRDCKIPQLTKYWKSKGSDVIQYVGIAADETKRLKRLDGTNKVSLLSKHNYTQADAKSLCEKYNLLSPIYEIAKRNGCWFCMNCSDKEWIHLIKNHPDLYEELIFLERHTQNQYRRCINRVETPSEIKNRLFGT